VRVKALVLMHERPACAKDLQDELGLTLATASHHVKELKKMALIEHVRDEPRRGAVAHFYRAVMRPLWSDEDWGKLSVEERQQYVIWMVQNLNCDISTALLAGTFNARVDTHSSCSQLDLDEQGRKEIHKVLDDALNATLAIQQASADRVAKGDSEAGQKVTSALLCVDMPS
jgi:DNA-binding transcriptional ArsR family regulator